MPRVKRRAIDRLDEHVQVRVLDRDVTDAEVLAPEHAAQRAPHVVVVRARPPRKPTGPAQHDVHRMHRLETPES